MRQKRQRKSVHDKLLTELCNKSRHVFSEWKKAGRPRQGDLFETRKKPKRDIQILLNRIRVFTTMTKCLPQTIQNASSPTNTRSGTPVTNSSLKTNYVLTDKTQSPFHLGKPYRISWFISSFNKSQHQPNKCPAIRACESLLP